MDVKNLSDLAKIINLCRKKGIESVKIGADSIEMRFAEPTQKGKRARLKSETPETPVEPVAPERSVEELLFWSSFDPSMEEEAKN